MLYLLICFPHFLPSDSNQDDNKKKFTKTDLQVLKPTASPSRSLHRTDKPPTTAVSTTSYATESKPEVSSGYIASVNTPDNDPTMDPYLTTHEESSTSTTTATTTSASKVIRGRIPWHRLYGGMEKEKILGKIKKPYIAKKTTTTAKTVTTTSTALPTTTSNSLHEFLSPSKHAGNKESSRDDDYGDISSADFEHTTLGPSLHYLTTTASYYPRSSTTTETPPKSQTLPAPPTVKPPSYKNTDEDVSSGSGALPDHWFAIRHRTSGRGWQGRRRRPFRGRRPYNWPTVAKSHPSTTVEPPTTDVTMMEKAAETTTLPQRTVSLLKPFYRPSRKEDRNAIVSTVLTSKEDDVNEEYDWSNVLSHTSTRPPLISSFTFTTTSMPATTRRPSTTAWPRVYNRFQLPTQISHHQRVGPTVPSSASRDKSLYFDTMTKLSAGQENTGEDDATSSFYDNFDDIEATSASFISTAKVITDKPKIVGGNAASFTVLSSSDAYMPCEAIGNPQPTITWKRFVSSTGTKTV